MKLKDKPQMTFNPHGIRGNEECEWWRSISLSNGHKPLYLLGSARAPCCLKFTEQFFSSTLFATPVLLRSLDVDFRLNNFEMWHL